MFSDTNGNFIFIPKPSRKKSSLVDICSSSYKEKDAFIYIENPESQHVTEVWEIINLHEVTSIIVIGQKKQQYWPKSGSVQAGPLQITSSSCIERSNIIIRDFELYNKKTKQIRAIRQWHLPNGIENWDDIFVLRMELVTWQNTNNQKALIHCRDGVQDPCMFIAVCSILEKIEIDQEVDVIFATKQLRRTGMKAFRTIDQYIKLHKIIKKYLDKNTEQQP